NYPGLAGRDSLQRAYGFTITSLKAVGRTEDYISAGIERGQVPHLQSLFLALLIVSGPEKSEGDVGLNQQRPWIYLLRPPEHVQRFIKTSSGGQKFSVPVVRHQIIRTLIEGPLKVAVCGLPVAVEMAANEPQRSKCG